MIKLVYLLLIFSLILLTGCGTIATALPVPIDFKKLSPTMAETTVFSNDQYVIFCKNIPRIYSGAVYNVCVWNKSYPHLNPPDFIVSLMGDTVVLPYTLVQEIRKGNLHLKTEK